MRISVGLNWTFAGLSVVLIRVLRLGPVPVWVFYIGFVVVWGLAMFLRYRFGRWKNIHLIEADAPRQ
jgi:Na+-driven multidrug efflux pump